MDSKYNLIVWHFMRTIFLYIVNAMAALVSAYCYVMDPFNIGTSKWNLAPLIFICAFFLLKYLYTKFDWKERETTHFWRQLWFYCCILLGLGYFWTSLNEMSTWFRYNMGIFVSWYYKIFILMVIITQTVFSCWSRVFSDHI